MFTAACIWNGFFLQILVGNKSDVADGKRAVPYQVGKALADEYKMQFFETSAKENTNVEEVSLAHLGD
jgi:GTPase SAR1 family protein